MHHIGTSLSRRFGSADALLQKLPPPAGATATAAQNKSYNFASMVDLVEDGGIMNKKQLAATHWDQICERLGGKSGAMSEETIRNLMTTYDFRIELMNELQDAVYDGGHRPEDLLRKKEFGRDDFCNLYCSLLKSRTISEATLLFDWLTSSQRSKHSLTRAQLVNLLFGYDKPLDWEREKLAELSVDIRASFRTVDEFLKLLDLDKVSGPAGSASSLPLLLSTSPASRSSPSSSFACSTHIQTSSPGSPSLIATTLAHSRLVYRTELSP